MTRVDRFPSQTAYGLTRDYREPPWPTDEHLLMGANRARPVGRRDGLRRALS